MIHTLPLYAPKRALVPFIEAVCVPRISLQPLEGRSGLESLIVLLRRRRRRWRWRWRLFATHATRPVWRIDDMTARRRRGWAIRIWWRRRSRLGDRVRCDSCQKSGSENKCFHDSVPLIQRASHLDRHCDCSWGGIELCQDLQIVERNRSLRHSPFISDR